MNREDHERAMDAQWRHSDHHYRGCLYDSALDARSEARYDDGRPDREPDPRDNPQFACTVDESGGLRGDTRG